MEKKNKFLLNIIIIITIIIIIIVSILFATTKKERERKKEIQNIIGNQIEHPGEIQIEKEFQEVNVRSLYYTMKNITGKYFDYIKQSQADTMYNKLEGEVKLTEKEKQTYFDILYTLYDQEYIKKNNITKNQIKESIETYKQADDIKYKKIYYKDINEDTTIFVSEVELLKENEKIGIEQLITGRLDKNNKTFGIIPENQNIEKIAGATFSENQIEKNTYNQYDYKNIEDAQIIEDFLTKYRETILYDRKEAYNLLDEEYREKRFGDYEAFDKYVNNNIREIASIKFTEYLINNYTGYKEYVCKDKYGNIYIFHETTIMNYKMMLDTYTLDNGTFIEKYKTSENQYKVMMNIDKIIQMLNARDYRTIFKLLDPNFKKTYFEDNEDIFEEYMKEYFPSHYTIEFGELAKETGIYIQEVTLKDMEQADRDLDKIFYMQLNNETDFIMSFNVARH